ncbi:hypothetical protein ACFWTC_38270 [Streptomyces sp. NPDC058619]|uniref:hypothetical protein n=1 Tax=unclassified Streptomyces TaxID=2593676 RepID=UPI003654388B
MSQQEQPWQPGPNDLPFTTHLINPHGDRHLGFNDGEGRYYRLWQYKAPEALHGFVGESAEICCRRVSAAVVDHCDGNYR